MVLDVDLDWEDFLMYIKKIHSGGFAGNSRFTVISQLRAGKTQSKRPRSHCMTYIFGKLWQPAINWPIRKSFQSGLHKLWYPGIRDRSTWGKFGAHGEHGDVFPFSNLGALWFSENLIRYSLHVCLREVKNNLFSFKHSYLRHFSWRF